MDDQNKNLILATALSFLVILVWFVMFPPPDPEVQPEPASQSATPEGVVADAPSSDVPGATGTATETRADALADAPRVAIETPRVTGSISLLGGRLDDLSLKDYRVTNDPEAPIVTVLSPLGSQSSYYALFGWAPGQGTSPESVPGAQTLWSVESGDTLTPETPVTLVWDNGAGQVFRRTLSIDENFMFNVVQSVENTGTAPASMAPYGILRRYGQPRDMKNFFILHEGVIAMADEELSEIDYDDVVDFDIHPRERVPAERLDDVSQGWIGFTDHYWMTTLIPDQDLTFRLTTKYLPGNDIYQTEIVKPTQTLEAGASLSVSTQFFAGPKEWEVIRDYERAGVGGFDDSIDWGWFWFLTKPIFWLLHEINLLIGNMGWAIIGLTLIIKAALLPLAFKSYVSMAKMKELQPEMEKLKEAAGDDRQKLQQGMLELYKKEKVNPASGCLPILLQIPIFFSLYKVIFVTIELRHAPWFGPFQDLSAPDPTSFINLFGLLSNPAPDPNSIWVWIFIGILPLCLGVSMWLQQKLNPAPTDPTQQAIFAWMPWIFMFMLGGFASGLVVYWIANNVITFIQQYAIMRSQGYKPDVFGNILQSFKKKPKSDGGK